MIEFEQRGYVGSEYLYTTVRCDSPGCEHQLWTSMPLESARSDVRQSKFFRPGRWTYWLYELELTVLDFCPNHGVIQTVDTAPDSSASHR